MPEKVRAVFVSWSCLCGTGSLRVQFDTVGPSHWRSAQCGGCGKIYEVCRPPFLERAAVGPAVNPTVRGH